MKSKFIFYQTLFVIVMTAFAVKVYASYASRDILMSAPETLTIAAEPELKVTAPEISDTDGDRLSDLLEKTIYHTDPENKDTDGDGFDDKTEIENSYSPLKPKLTLKAVDTDQDGLSDDWELKIGSNLDNPDTDNDGKNDWTEVLNGFSPISADQTPVAKRIEVNIKDFTLKYFFGETMLDSFLVSTGRKYMETPTGEFTVLDKVPSKNYGGGPYSFYYPNTKWNLHFTTGKNKLRYYIHGAYWHNEFGKKNMSSGCVNVAYKDMEALYNFASVGTKVSIK